jgi:hypothetical protein
MDIELTPNCNVRDEICFAITDIQIRYKVQEHKDVKVVQIILLNFKSLFQTNFPDESLTSNFIKTANR